MPYEERALAFVCGAETLVGVLSVPACPQATAVVVVVGGPQYRAGSHRQFVLLARALAEAGHAVLRFDVRGMGDSGGEARDFESVSDDIGCAVDALKRAMPEVRHVVLWGLCDGASAALMYVERRREPKVAGLCLLNPWVRSETSLARTQVKHYYTRRVLQREFWIKLASGGVAAGALRDLGRSVLRSMSRGRSESAGSGTPASADSRVYQDVMAAGWQRFAGPVLLVLSGDDYTAKEFIEYIAADPHWRGAIGRPLLRREDVAEADHTFSASASRRQVEALTLEWLRDAWPGAGRDAA